MVKKLGGILTAFFILYTQKAFYRGPKSLNVTFSLSEYVERAVDPSRQSPGKGQDKGRKGPFSYYVK